MAVSHFVLKGARSTLKVSEFLVCNDYCKSSIKPPGGGLVYFFSPRGDLKERGLIKMLKQKVFKNALVHLLLN